RMDCTSHWNLCFCELVAIFSTICHENIQAKRARASNSGRNGDTSIACCSVRCLGSCYWHIYFYTVWNRSFTCLDGCSVPRIIACIVITSSRREGTEARRSQQFHEGIDCW